jgi:hypothetical protein
MKKAAMPHLFYAPRDEKEKLNLNKAITISRNCNEYALN